MIVVSHVAALIEPAFYAVSIVVALLAIRTYRRDSARRRAEWLMSLYERFYEMEYYKRVRYVLDYRPTPEYQELHQALTSDSSDETAECLVNYLNFFEFIASLWQLDQLSLDDVRALFDYYLRNLHAHPWVMAFVSEQGFESLRDMLDHFEPVQEGA